MARNKIADRQIARIIAAVADAALSQQELSAKLHMSQTSVDRFITRLLGESPRRVYVERWEDSGKNPRRLIRAGSLPDAVYVTKYDRKKQASRFAEADRRRAEVLTLLVLPQTSYQLAKRMSICVSSVTRYLQEHREAKPKRVYIKGWLPPPHRGSQLPVYAVGDLPDKPRTSKARPKEKPVSVGSIHAIKGEVYSLLGAP